MLNKIIKRTAAILSCVALMSTFAVNVSANNLLAELQTGNCTIEIMSGGTKVQLENKPFIENGEVYLPIRELVNLLDKNAAVEWNEGTVSVLTKDNAYLLTIGKSEVSINPSKADAATYSRTAKNTAVLKDDRTFVPYSLFEIIFDNPEKAVSYAVYDNTQQCEKSAVWANAMITRDGEPRYKMMTADMQKQFIENQKAYIGSEDWNYVIGYSNPSTVLYNITVLNDKAEITYYQTDSSNERYIITEKLVFENKNGAVYVNGSEIDY